MRPLGAGLVEPTSQQLAVPSGKERRMCGRRGKKGVSLKDRRGRYASLAAPPMDSLLLPGLVERDSNSDPVRMVVKDT